MKTRFITTIILFISISISKGYAQETLSAKQWQEDLRFLQSTVHKEYPFLLKKVTAKDFDAAVEKLHKEIPYLELHKLPVAFSRIVSLFKYGHSQIPYSTIAKDGVLPVNLYHFNDGIYIEGVQKQHKKTLGAKVIKIGEIPVETALSLIQSVVPAENDSYFKAYGLRFLTVPAVLHAQKVIPNLSQKVTLTLEKDGKVFTYTFPTIDLKEISKNINFTIPNEHWLSIRENTQTPLYLKYLNEKYYYFEYLTNTKTLYVRQSSVFNDESESLKDFYSRLFTFIDNNEVDKLVYDVRLNGGGNNYNNIPLIKGLMARPKINKRGKFFYIIGRNTFSACQNLTNEIGKYTEAIIIGEPTAENVNFYGDARRITLPNSNINTYLSYAWWQDRAPWENRDATLPHIAVDMSFEEYRTNEDPVIDIALNYTEKGFILNPMQHLTALFSAGDYAQIKIDGAKIAKDPAYRYYDFQKEFSNTGQRMLNSGNAPAGLFIFELVAESYPSSASALYNLANAQEENKQFEKAKTSYKKVIALDAEGSLAKSAKRRLEKLNK